MLCLSLQKAREKIKGTTGLSDKEGTAWIYEGQLVPAQSIAFCHEIPCFVSGKRTRDGVYLDWRNRLTRTL